MINGAKRFPPNPLSFSAKRYRQEMSLFWPIEQRLSLHRRRRRPRRRGTAGGTSRAPFIGLTDRGRLLLEDYDDDDDDVVSVLR